MNKNFEGMIKNVKNLSYINFVLRQLSFALPQKAWLNMNFSFL